MGSKSTLLIYQQYKNNIKEEQFYDNRPSSITLYRARTNCLPLFDRKRHQHQDTTCRICDQTEETLEHFLLDCTGYQDIRQENKALQQPYTENRTEIIGKLLFEEANIESTKETLSKMWKLRTQQFKEKNLI